MDLFELDDFPALQQARDQWKAGRADEALQGYESAANLRPRNVRALVEFARALGQRYQIKSAEELLTRANQLAAGSELAVPMIAQAFRGIYRPARAIGLLEELRQRNRLPLPMLGELSVLYEQSGRFDDAQAAIAECVAKAPYRDEPKLILARVQRLRGELEVAARTLRELTRVAGAPPMLHVRAWSELCQIRDRQGDYLGAIDAIERAKAILRGFPRAAEMSRQAAALNDAFARLYSELDETLLARWATLELPQEDHSAGIAHLLGFPRSGTTLLEQVLDAHPKILSAPERAIFSKQIFPAICQVDGRQVISLEALKSTSPDVLIRERNRYLGCHQEVHGQALKRRVHLDKNPNHTSLMAGLFRLFPESRFIFALRDPRDVVVSAYLRYFPLSEFSASFLTWGSTCSLYAHEMNVWLRMRHLMNDNWIEVRYEDTVKDVQQQSRRVFRFLGLNWDEAVKDYRDHTRQKVINSPSHAEARQPVYTHAIGRWKNYQRYVEPYLERLEPFVQTFAYD